MIRYLFVLLVTWQLMWEGKSSIIGTNNVVPVTHRNTLTNFITQSGKGTAKERHSVTDSAIVEEVKEEFDIKSKEGGVATLPCLANRYQPSSIQWRKGSTMINTNQERYELTSTGDLQIEQLHRTDSGRYVCIADNGFGEPVQREVQLTVNVPVKVAMDLPQGQHPLPKSNFTINCTVDGYPKPTVYWFKNGRIIEPTERIHITDENMLIVTEALPFDSGIYKCFARNEHSEDFGLTAVKVFKEYYRGGRTCTMNRTFPLCYHVIQHLCGVDYNGPNKYCCICSHKYLYPYDEFGIDVEWYIQTRIEHQQRV